VGEVFRVRLIVKDGRPTLQIFTIPGFREGVVFRFHIIGGMFNELAFMLERRNVQVGLFMASLTEENMACL
jgi:hypothetical protein